MTEDEAAIRQLDADWGAAVTARDLEWLCALYAPDGGLLWPGAPAVFGAANIRGAWQRLLTTPGLSLGFTPDRIDIAGDLATDYGAVAMGQTGPSGPETQSAKYLVAWRKVDGRWRVLYDCFNMNSGS
jgi:uncharacterized protein (TIGR02246 family)